MVPKVKITIDNINVRIIINKHFSAVCGVDIEKESEQDGEYNKMDILSCLGE